MFEVDEQNIWFYDDLVSELEAEWIGGISVKMFKEAQDSFDGQPYNLRINSPGGDVQAALSIFNLIDNYPGEVTAVVDAWAASALSYIPMAADRIVMADNAKLMIHAPHASARGNAEELMDAVDMLKLHQETLLKTYTRRTGLSSEEVGKWFKGDNWFNAEQSLELGLADEIIEPKIKIQNRVNPKVYNYKNIPPEWQDSTVKRFAASVVERPFTNDEQNRLEMVKGKIESMV